MPQRSFASGDYRFGMQGWEKDNEISGVGNSYTTFFRQHDSRLVRTWSRDPKRQYPSPYVMLGNNPINGVDPDGAWFWEKANVREARKFARETGGKFEKWKGSDDKKYASVTIGTRDKGTGKSPTNLDNYNVTTKIFRPGENNTDLLKKSGVGFYEAMSTSTSGLESFTWMWKGMDDVFKDYSRKGDAPHWIKPVVGLNPLVSVPNAINVLWSGEDIYGVEATTITDKSIAVAEATIGGVLPFLKLAKPVIGTVKAVNVVEKVNQTVQITNDLGGFDKLKEMEKKKDE